MQRYFKTSNKMHICYSVLLSRLYSYCVNFLKHSLFQYEGFILFVLHLKMYINPQINSKGIVFNFFIHHLKHLQQYNQFSIEITSKLVAIFSQNSFKMHLFSNIKGQIQTLTQKLSVSVMKTLDEAYKFYPNCTAY